MNIRRIFFSRQGKSLTRIVLATILVVNISFIGLSYVNRYESVEGPTANTDVGDKIADENSGITVITTQGSPPTELPRAAVSGPNGGVYAIGTSGRVIYMNTTYHSYWDVDPIPDKQASVMYAAGQYISPEECGTKSPCWKRRVQVVNFTTGEVRELHSDLWGGGKGGRWHDVDRYDNDSILVADISEDRVLIVNTTSGLVEWSWEADDAFPPSSGNASRGAGGKFGGDWTHINDVELLPDGRIMADLRNHDVVIFLDPSTGLQEDWTLGEDDDHGILYEQHNPDYIPGSQGGPAVVVADSNNNRIVEYQRVNNSWERSWIWQDSRMNWPRDADRLPNGNTLITDSGSNRVFEINREGKNIWSVTADNPYEAERLETGDESQGGESTTRLGLGSRTVADEQNGKGGLRSVIKSTIPDVVINAIIFVKPVWMGFYHIGASILIFGILLIWPPLEFYWSGYKLGIRTPIVLDRK